MLPATSLRITMGMLVTGSIISPRIFISTSMLGPPSLVVSLHHASPPAVLGGVCFAHQRIGTGARDTHRKIPADQVYVRFRVREIQSAILGCAANPLTQRLVASFNIHLLDEADSG